MTIRIFLACVAVVGIFSCKDKPTAPETVKLTIVNNVEVIGFSYDMTAVYIKPSEMNAWGQSRGRIAYGESLVLDIEKGTYDIKCVDTDDDDYIKREVSLLSDYIWTVTFIDLFAKGVPSDKVSQK